MLLAMAKFINCELRVAPNQNQIPKYGNQRVAYLLVHFDTNCTLGYVPDTAGAAMVELVWHALLDRAINFNIHVVPDFVSSEVGCQCYGTLLPEWPRERVSSPRSQTVSGRHFQRILFAAKMELECRAEEAANLLARCLWLHL